MNDISILFIVCFVFFILAVNFCVICVFLNVNENFIIVGLAFLFISSFFSFIYFDYYSDESVVGRNEYDFMSDFCSEKGLFYERDSDLEHSYGYFKCIGVGTEGEPKQYNYKKVW